MTIRLKNIACAILAGGNNSRIGGKDKAFIKIGNSSIIEKITAEIETIFDELIIVTNNTEKFDHFKDRYSIITDTIKNIGPLGGIYTALNFTKSEAVFFVPCDMPFINFKTIESITNEYLKAKHDAIVPRIGSLIEPLHSLYKTDNKDILFEYIQTNNDYSISQFLKKINVCYLDMENNDFNNKTFTNINSDFDLERVKRNLLPEKHEIL